MAVRTRVPDGCGRYTGSQNTTPPPITKAPLMPKTVAVIDGNSLMHRAYHAVPPSMNAPDGTPTNACFGFLSMLIKFIETTSPDAIVCAFDAGKPAFRIKAMEQYKAQRPHMDDELRVQFPVMEQLLEAMEIPVVKVPGWEGDDILGTVAARDEARGYRTLLVTGDKDAYQLATDLTSIVTTKKGITDVAVYGPDEVFERYGVTPAQFPDFLGLKGDTADNIPGVPGVGDKTAAKFLSKYGSLEGLYEHLDDLKGKQLEKVRDNRDSAFLSREIATIVTDLDFPLDVEQVHWPAFDAQTLTTAFLQVGFRSHLTRVLRFEGAASAADAPAAVAIAAHEPVEGEPAADELVRAACAAGTPVGVALAQGPETLFGPSLQLAVDDGTAAALFAGERAQQALAQLVAEGVPVALDFKELLKPVFPSDTALPAQVSAQQVLDARFFDAALAAYSLDSSAEGYTLAHLCERYLHAPLPAPAEDGTAADLLVQAVALQRLRQPLLDALEADGTRSVYEDLDAPLVGVLAIMERTGAAIDAATLEQMGQVTGAEIEKVRAQIYELAGEEFNIDSPKQVGHILFEVMGMKPLKKTTRGYSTSAAVLKELAQDNQVPALILHYRELAKLKSTYIDALPSLRAGDGRVHTSFNETVTTTGRLSSSHPNLQNIPVRTDFGRHIRACFVPLREGETFLSADYSQIELRLLAHLSGDERLIEAFRSGADFHAQTASHVFGVPVEQVTPQMRSRAKAVNFGIVYGQQAFGLSQSLHIPYGEAQDMIDRYFEVYPGVRAYLDQTVAQATEDGYAETMFGRKRHIPELVAGNRNKRSFGERTAMNHPMQGSAADIIKKAMVTVQRRLQEGGFGARLILQVHDELCLSVPDGELEPVRVLVCDAMEHAVELKVPLLVEANNAANWALAH